MADDLRRRLIALYAELGAHTEPECAGNRCPKPLSCCAPMYCDLASDFALEHWGVKLNPGWHPTLPFMGPTGCTVAPHLRPICTAHTCEVNEHGYFLTRTSKAVRDRCLDEDSPIARASVSSSGARPSGMAAVSSPFFT